VILVLAADGDQGAAALAAELAPRPARVVSCLDFAASPFALHDPGLQASSVTIGGERVPLPAIEAVVNALPAVSPDALVVYDPAEREYQAAEMHAWLSFVLAALPCPVLNPPSRLSLTGPVLNALGWFHLARAAGVPVAATEVSSDDVHGPARAAGADALEVTWASGTAERTCGLRYTGAIARRAGLGYLKAWYRRGASGRPLFAGASSVPDLASESTRRRIAAALGA
jgi:hypothetical protein